MLDEDDITLITVPGWGNSGAEHWQTAWERSYPLARRVEQGDWLYPECEAWVDGIRRTLEQVPGRWMLAAHSLAAMRRRRLRTLSLREQKRLQGLLLGAPPCRSARRGRAPAANCRRTRPCPLSPALTRRRCACPRRPYWWPVATTCSATWPRPKRWRKPGAVLGRRRRAWTPGQRRAAGAVALRPGFAAGTDAGLSGLSAQPAAPDRCTIRSRSRGRAGRPRSRHGSSPADYGRR